MTRLHTTKHIVHSLAGWFGLALNLKAFILEEGESEVVDVVMRSSVARQRLSSWLARPS